MLFYCKKTSKHLLKRMKANASKYIYNIFNWSIPANALINRHVSCFILKTIVAANIMTLVFFYNSR